MMNDPDNSTDPAEAKAGRTGAADERERRIADLSTRLGHLHDLLETAGQEKSRILAQANLAQGAAAYQQMRRRLEEGPEKLMASVADEISATMVQLREVQSANPAFAAVRADPAAPIDARILALDEQLSGIAQAQTAAVAEWNADPAPARRAGFEARAAELHAEFGTLLAEKKSCLQRKGSA